MRAVARIVLAALAMSMVAVPSHAAPGDLEPVAVFEDGAGDGPIGAGVDAYQDLTAGYIAEDAKNITLIWQVDDIPDPLTNGVPAISAYYWDFSIDDAANGRGKQSYELSVAPNPINLGATLGQNCTLTGTLWSCAAIGAKMTLKIDSIADTISVSIARSSLKDPTTGKSIAENGAVLEQQVFFAGIGAFTTTPAVTPGGTEDDATMDDVYILGTPR
jgi:hypothetical protein